MTFNLDDAKSLVDHYGFLIGAVMDPSLGMKIGYILIAPSEERRFTRFRAAFRGNRNNKASLFESGYDRSSVRLVVANEYGPSLYMLELDVYLLDNNIERAYLPDLLPDRHRTP